MKYLNTAIVRTIFTFTLGTTELSARGHEFLLHKARSHLVPASPPNPQSADCPLSWPSPPGCFMTAPHFNFQRTQTSLSRFTATRSGPSVSCLANKEKESRPQRGLAQGWGSNMASAPAKALATIPVKCLECSRRGAHIPWRDSAHDCFCTRTLSGLL
jgi:hypothetical protein